MPGGSEASAEGEKDQALLTTEDTEAQRKPGFLCAFVSSVVKRFSHPVAYPHQASTFNAHAGDTMPFSQASLRFFRQLAKNNNKPWFEAHRDEYEGEVRTPMRELIEEMNAR